MQSTLSIEEVHRVHQEALRGEWPADVLHKSILVLGYRALLKVHPYRKEYAPLLVEHLKALSHLVFVSRNSVCFEHRMTLPNP